MQSRNWLNGPRIIHSTFRCWPFSTPAAMQANVDFRGYSGSFSRSAEPRIRVGAAQMELGAARCVKACYKFTSDALGRTSGQLKG